MRKTIVLLLIAFFSATLRTVAQVEGPNTTTVLDASWTEVDRAEASSDGDLHLAGQSKVDFTVTNTTTKAQSYSYRTTIEIRSMAGIKKAVKYYICTRDDRGNVSWKVSDDDVTYEDAGTGRSVNGSMSLSNGETGDYIYMSIKRIDAHGIISVILSALSSTTTRYDLYDHLKLFGTDTGTSPTSNRIKNHTSIIDVYVHRTIMGNGTWSTLCLPFDMTDVQVKRALGNNVVYSEFTDVDLYHKYINFTSTTGGMKAGKPYLIQNNGNTVENFFANDVTFTQHSVRMANANRRSEAESKGYYFVGLLEPTKVNTGDPVYNPNGTAVYIANPSVAGDRQHLKRLSADGTIKAFRAYLVFPQDGASGIKDAGSMFINLDEALNTVTDVTKIKVDGREISNRIYNLNGQYVGSDADSLPKGIYIRNGKKFMVR